jgi:catechol 2,3-dioxygenase-like lactoylglutathione lyase family enzyme
MSWRSPRCLQHMRIDTTDNQRSIMAGASVATRLPAQDLERARGWYRDKLGLEPAQEREGGLLYEVANGSFALFASVGAPAGDHTQIAWDVADIHAAVSELERRGVVFDDVGIPGLTMVDSVVEVGGNYPSKGRSELAAWFADSEGNVHGLGQAVR